MHHVMARFVPHHRQQLAPIEFGDKGVPQHNALRPHETGHVRIDRLRVGAFVHFVNPAALDARALCQRENLGLERLVLQRAEMVEQRIDPEGRDEHHQDRGRRGGDPGIEPPPARAVPHQQIRKPEKGRQTRRVHRQALEGIAEPAAKGLVGQSVSVLSKESLITI